METIVEKLLKEVATILTLDPGSISPQSPLHSLGMDSLRFVELLVFIEKEYALNLMESGLTKDDFQSVASLAGRIEELA